MSRGNSSSQGKLRRDRWGPTWTGHPPRRPELTLTSPRTFLLRGAGSSNRKASGSVSNPGSVWGEPKASPRYLGLAWGWGGEGVETPLLPLQCPLVVLLPLSDTSPLSFHGSQAAREAGGEKRGDTHGPVPRQSSWHGPVCIRFHKDSPGQRPPHSHLEPGFRNPIPGSGSARLCHVREERPRPPLSELQQK